MNQICLHMTGYYGISRDDQNVCLLIALFLILFFAWYIKDGMLIDDRISKVAHYMFEQTDCHCLEPEYCLDCATFCDLQTSKKSITKAEIHIKRYFWLNLLLRFVSLMLTLFHHQSLGFPYVKNSCSYKYMLKLFLSLLGSSGSMFHVCLYFVIMNLIIYLMVRMKDALASGALTTNLLMDALSYVDILRAILHPFNKRIAEVGL